MLPDYELSNHQLWNVRLINLVFGALRQDRYLEFLKTGELDRFLNGPGGAFGGTLADGEPGSKLPTTGTQSPFDALRGLFGGLAAGLGEVDRAFGVDPAATGPDHVRVIPHHENGVQGAVIHYADGRVEMWGFNDDGRYQSIMRDGHTVTNQLISPGESPGQCLVETWTYVDGRLTSHELVKYLPSGNRAPGESGGDANADRNPLSGLDILGPQSIQQMLYALENAGKDAHELDPNTGMDGLQLTKEDEERLGRIAPAFETLDPNSGMGPLSSLNLDPNQMTTRSEKDDRIDPNTGLKPMPGGG